VYLKSEDEKGNLICNTCFNHISVYKTISYSPQFTLAAVTSYESSATRELLHAFKYKKFLGAGNAIEKLIEKYLNNVDIQNIVSGDSVIVPIPLHKKRMRQRGFNQAEEIAKILSKYLKLPVENKILVKTIDTPHQTTLENKLERKESVKNSFEISSKDLIKGKNVILVDDVYTSGATMNEAAKILRRAGVKNIIGFVVAKTV